MKQNKFLATISSFALIILVSILIVFVFAIYAKENINYNEEKFFNSNAFAATYMQYLKNGVYELIHNNDNLQSIYDGEIEIHYSIEQIDYSQIKDGYYLIIYENKALTNLELTNTTNTVESIKSYIKNNENSKNVDIIYGDIKSESNIIQQVGIQYLNSLTEIYYTRENTMIEYKAAEAEDFQIYSSFVEEFEEDSQVAVINNLVEKISPYEKYSYFIIPVSSILIVLILVYLVISIGHEKGKESIILNDFDKIPLEIILILAIIIGCIPFIAILGVHENYKAITSLFITLYLVVFVLCLIVLNTIIKRIKSKTLLKSSITGKILIWMTRCLEKIYIKLKSGWDTITYSTNITVKVLAYFGFTAFIGIFILLVFREALIVILLEGTVVTLLMYKTIKALKGYSQIENKLKEMYEGNNSTKLEEAEFIPEFKNIIKYLNDISNGFENAIQDRMKSERLKAELITNVSHDIKTPLTSIINYVDLLKQENIQNEKVREYIAILDNKSQRLKKLTEDLVEASKVSTGNISLNIEKIDVVQLIKQALGEFEDRFKKRGLDIIVDCQENDIYINADSRYMYRIIENLFSNISKYALENSRVYIDIKKTQKHVTVEMKNISKERLNISAEELMQRFVRGDKSRTTEGSGLGISIAQNLTELQGGKFSLKLDGDLFKVQVGWDI